MRERVSADILPRLLLLLIIVAFFFPLWGQGAWLPRGGGDAASFLFPMYRFIAGAFHAGELPLWNPHQYAGYPLIADNQAGLFYPPYLLLFLLHPTFSYRWLELLVAAHLLWAALGVVWSGECRDRDRDRDRDRGRGDAIPNPQSPIPNPLTQSPIPNPRSPIPIILPAVAFAFSDLFIIHQGNLNLIAVAAWLPWAVGALQRAITRQAWGWAIASGAAIGTATLAGHGQMTFLLAFFVSLWALWQALARRSLRPLGMLALAGVTALALSAVILLPMLESADLTRRATFSYADSIQYSLPWQGLAGLVAPGFFGRNSADFWPAWSRVEYGYSGVVTLILAALALWYAPRRQTVFLAGAALLTLLLALGGNTPVHRWLIGPLALPFQVPARFVLLTSFCLALLAGLGAQRLAGKNRPNLRPFLTVFAAASLALIAGLLLLRSGYPDHATQTGRAVLILAATLTAGGLILWRSRRPLPWLLALLLAELFLHGQYSEISRANPVAGYEHVAATTWLQQHAGLARIDEATGVWQASAAQMHRLYSAGGVFNPLQMATHAALIESLGYRGSPTYNLLGIQYIIGEKTEPPGDTAFLFPVFDDDPAVSVWLNSRALPRALFLHEAMVVPDHDAAFAALFSGIDFSRTLILEAPAANRPPGQGQATIGLAVYELNRVVIDVATEAPGWLFLGDMHHPGWQVRVNGESADLLRANYAFRAVALEAGSHSVVMDFRPKGWQVGWPISAAAWLALAAAGMGSWYRRANS
jgi:hypothetical protein